MCRAWCPSVLGCILLLGLPTEVHGQATPMAEEVGPCSFCAGSWYVFWQKEQCLQLENREGVLQAFSSSASGEAMKSTRFCFKISFDFTVIISIALINPYIVNLKQFAGFFNWLNLRWNKKRSPSVSLRLNKHISVRTTKVTPKGRVLTVGWGGQMCRLSRCADVQAFRPLCVPSDEWGAQPYAIPDGCLSSHMLLSWGDGGDVRRAWVKSTEFTASAYMLWFVKKEQRKRVGDCEWRFTKAILTCIFHTIVYQSFMSIWSWPQNLFDCTISFFVCPSLTADWICSNFCPYQMPLCWLHACLALAPVRHHLRTTNLLPCSVCSCISVPKGGFILKHWGYFNIVSCPFKPGAPSVEFGSCKWAWKGKSRKRWELAKKASLGLLTYCSAELSRRGWEWNWGPQAGFSYAGLCFVAICCRKKS